MMSVSPSGPERKARESNPHPLTGARISGAARQTVSGYLPKSGAYGCRSRTYASTGHRAEPLHQSTDTFAAVPPRLFDRRTTGPIGSRNPRANETALSGRCTAWHDDSVPLLRGRLMSDPRWMRQAIDKTLEGIAAGQAPFGAVIVARWPIDSARPTIAYGPIPIPRPTPRSTPFARPRGSSPRLACTAARCTRPASRARCACPPSTGRSSTA